jgi:predicted DNA-binding transcriptional regulator AlpA
MNEATTLEIRELLTLAEVSALVKAAKSTILQWEADGMFPASVKLGPKIRRWYKDEVIAWMNTRPPNPGRTPPAPRRGRKSRKRSR